MRGEPNKVSVSNVPAISVTSPVMSKPSNKSSPVVKEKLTGKFYFRRV